MIAITGLGRFEEVHDSTCSRNGLADGELALGQGYPARASRCAEILIVVYKHLDCKESNKKLIKGIFMAVYDVGYEDGKTDR